MHTSAKFEGRAKKNKKMCFPSKFKFVIILTPNAQNNSNDNILFIRNVSPEGLEKLFQRNWTASLLVLCRNIRELVI